MRTAHRLFACGLIVAAHHAGCGGDDAGNAPGDGAAANAGAGGASGGGGKNGGSSGSSGGAATEPVKGDTEFVSADVQSAGGGGRGIEFDNASDAAAGAPSAGATDGPGFGNSSNGDARSVERGDIYRVLDDGRILNLNGYRGLQVIDIRDLHAPKVEGRLEARGTPVEMYVAGDRALILLNDWSGYYGTRDDVAVEQRQGGLVASVDISDRAHPKLLAQAIVPGEISTSRLTQGGGQAALYVASNGYYDASDGRDHTYVKSFDVSGESLIEKSQLDLGGYVADIQATVDVLLVAGQDWTNGTQRSTVSVIDISRPDGTMVQGGTITAAGTVENKFNMDAYDGVLRVVSGVTWSGTRENHLETFDMSDLKKLAPLGHCTFGAGEMLEATLFMEERAFFVTFFQTDPFHSFSIDAQGRCEEHNEFVVSGWNDFLRPALNDTRIIGVGTNTDSQSRAVSVSLYDATDVDNPKPLLARADVDATQYSYSEAQWDDRAFSVIEDAVQVKAEDGTTETGLILLPFQGWDGERSLAQVQIFTFSDHTLTMRGTMDHGSSVRRSFPTDAATTANLSEEQLSLFDTRDPDQPSELGRVDVAPNYSKVLVFGDHVARVKDRSMYFGWQSSTTSVAPPTTRVDILKRNGDLESTAPVASFDVPANADLVQVGDLLVSVAMEATDALDAKNEPTYDSAIDVYDLSDPAHPRKRGSLETDRLYPGYSYYGYALDFVGDCFDCGGYGRYGWGYRYGVQSDHYVAGDAIAFAHRTQQQKSLGMVHTCNWYVSRTSDAACAANKDGVTECTGSFVNGSLSCTTPKGGEEWCTGGFQDCSYDTGKCTDIDRPKDAAESCYDYEQFRYWQSYAIDTLDLRDPDAPVLAKTVALAADEEGQSIYSDGQQLFFNFQKPFDVSGDARAHVKRYVRPIDLSDPQNPDVGAPINVPGEVIARDGDTVYTRDVVWDDDDTRTLVARLTIADGRAHLQTSHLFQDKTVQAVRLDGAGHMLVSSDPVYVYNPVATSSAEPQPHTLEILDDQSLSVIGHADVDSWATFMDAKAGRALYQVGSGLLVFDVQDAAHPTAQAYFATLGWPQELYFDGEEILFAAGPYGVYRYDADVYNLLQK
jgi:hypothetical protein